MCNTKTLLIALLLLSINSIGSRCQNSELIRLNQFFNIVFKEDFTNNTTGEYLKEEWLNDWNKPTWANHAIGYGEIVAGDNNKYLQESFPPGAFLLKGSGTQWHVKFSKGYNELYLSYRLKFSEGFSDSNLHGKLPGLSGGTSNNGGDIPDGSDGWSTRYMFHGTAINFYIYYPDLYKTYGDAAPVPGKKYYGSGPVLQPGYNLKPGVWYTVTQRVVLNTPGKSDGFVEGFIDGKLCARQAGIRFRDTPGLMIDRIFFSNFLGGSGKPTTRNEYICFDDFFVFTYKPWLPNSGNISNPFGTFILLPDLKPIKTWENSIKVTSSSNGVTEINWEAFPLTVSGYTVERESGNDAQFSPIKNLNSGQLSFKDSAALSANKYIYRIKAYNTPGFTYSSKEISP